MTVPVRWLLGRRALGLVLRAGHAGVSAPIGVVTTTELTDPTPWLSGGELVLTTGIGLPEDDDGRRAYLYRLADAGVAALGFGVGVRMPATPRALIDAADERGLALFDVPLPTPFVALVQAVVNESARQQSQSSTHARNVQQRMTRAAVSGGILRNTGILFETDGLTGFPLLDDTGSNSYGGAIGLNWLADDFSHQVVLELATVQTFGLQAGRKAVDDQYGLGARYQKPLNQAWILRLDALYGFLDSADDLTGGRVELRYKF